MMLRRIAHIALAILLLTTLIAVMAEIWVAGAMAPAGDPNQKVIDESVVCDTPVDDSIKPGMTVHVKKTIDRFITTLPVDLKWDRPNANLSIVVYSPSSMQFGPWWDGCDGNIDQRICRDIYNTGGVEQGEWDYYIKNWGTEATDYHV